MGNGDDNDGNFEESNGKILGHCWEISRTLMGKSKTVTGNQ